MELITLKDAAKMTQLSYTYLFVNKSKYGFAQQSNKGKWLVDKKEFEEKFKANNNSDRLTSKEGVKKCQLKNAGKLGILTSSRQMDQELGDLLERSKKRKHKNIMTG